MKKVMLAAILLTAIPATAKIPNPGRPHARAHYKNGRGCPCGCPSLCPIKSWKNHSNPQYRKWYEEDGGDAAFTRIIPETYQEVLDPHNPPEIIQYDRRWELPISNPEHPIHTLRYRTKEMVLGAILYAGLGFACRNDIYRHIGMQLVNLILHRRTIRELIYGEK